MQSQPGWDRILLPTRPNRSTGWIYLGGGGLRIAYTAYQVKVSLAACRLTILVTGYVASGLTAAVISVLVFLVFGLLWFAFPLTRR